MTIKHKKDDRTVTVQVEGRIDTSTAPQFLDELKSLMVDIDELIIDLKDVEYISSAGLRDILFAQKTMNSLGSMKIINVNETIMEVFELTGFVDILNIE